MRIFDRSAIEQQGRRHATAREALRAWYEDALQAEWNSPEDVKQRFPRASVIANDRIVFNIAGNAYRLIVSFNHKFRAGYIEFFGTHAAYDRVDAATVDESRTHRGKTQH